MMRMVNRVLRPHPVPAMVTQSMRSEPPETDVIFCCNPAWLTPEFRKMVGDGVPTEREDLEGLPVHQMTEASGLDYQQTSIFKAAQQGGTHSMLLPDVARCVYSTRLPSVGVDAHSTFVLNTVHHANTDDDLKAHREHYRLEHVLRLAFAATAAHENLLMAERMLLESSRQQQNLIETIIERADFIAAETAMDSGLLLDDVQAMRELSSRELAPRRRA